MKRLPIDSDIVRELADGAVSVDDVSDVIERVRQVSAGPPGLCVLSGFDVVDGDEQREAFRSICALVGELMPQDGAGTLVRAVRDKGYTLGQGRSGRYADTRDGGNLHTDGAEAPPPVPESFALMCVRPAEEGGALQFAHIDDVMPLLPPDAAARLREPFHFDRRGDEGPGEAPTAQKPVLFDDDGRTGITYLRRYIELGHGRPDVPDLEPEQLDALDALDAAVARPGVTKEDLLEAGEVAIIDNRHVLHGRTPFVDADDPSRRRLLYRTWIAAYARAT